MNRIVAFLSSSLIMTACGLDVEDADSTAGPAVGADAGTAVAQDAEPSEAPADSSIDSGPGGSDAGVVSDAATGADVDEIVVEPSCEPMAIRECPSISECSDVLEAALGVEMTTYENEERSTREMAKTYLCSESNGTYLFQKLRSQQAGGGVSVAFFSVEGGGSALESETAFRSWQRSSCSQDIERASLDELRQYFMTIDDRRESVYAWTECVTAITACHAASAPNPRGLMVVVNEPEADAVALTVRWCGTVGDVRITEATVSDVQTPGLDCSQPLEAGRPLPIGDTLVLCTRLEDEVDGIFSVMADVNVGMGAIRRYSANQIIPGREVEQPCEEKEYFFDPDGDGYATADARTMFACEPPEGQDDIWTLRAPLVWTDTDCCELDPDARPGQTTFFTEANACGRFDYDCDGEARVQSSAVAQCEWRSGDGDRVRSAGWAPRWGVPACGDMGQHAVVGTMCWRGFPFETVERQQACR